MRISKYELRNLLNLIHQFENRMAEIQFKFIAPDNILTTIPLLKQVTLEVDEDLLAERMNEMVNQNYKCLGIYHLDKLIGICGLWFMTRHYCGKTVEPDHVIIDDTFRGKGIGKRLFEWIFDYCEAQNIEATELNTYVENTRSHKFYYNLGYEIKGYHFLKIF